MTDPSQILITGRHESHKHDGLIVTSSLFGQTLPQLSGLLVGCISQLSEYSLYITSALTNLRYSFYQHGDLDMLVSCSSDEGDMLTSTRKSAIQAEETL